MAELSKSQVDRLGERLREGSHTESDLRMLDEFRASFAGPYESVLQTIRNRSQLPTGRIAKSTISIVEKLRRIKNLRLSRMQDIAGCRVVVANILEQDQLVAALRNDFPVASVVDRRDKPSHGYRAIHFIAKVSGKHVEVQVRSSLQHLWAEFSEKASDVLDPNIKYGGGPEYWRNILVSASELVKAEELYEIAQLKKIVATKVVIHTHEYLKKAVTDLLKLNPTEEEVPGIQLRELRDQVRTSAHRISSAKMEIESDRVKLVQERDKTANRLKAAIVKLDQLKEKKQ